MNGDCYKSRERIHEDTVKQLLKDHYENTRPED